MAELEHWWARLRSEILAVPMTEENAAQIEGATIERSGREIIISDIPSPILRGLVERIADADQQWPRGCETVRIRG